ncbi:fucose isomerase [Candidatus Sumerlaeota bacterium]|nr:fucose isomerase [Candidatus Sumerlaeota bacterium]
MIASGDLRLSANQNCWAAQKEMEDKIAAAVKRAGRKLVRGHAYDPREKHGFISSQRMGMEVFKKIDPNAPLIVAEAVWQYSHHVLAGLTTHRGPILTLANWSGQWPGLVGMLNLNGSLTKAGVKYSTLWSENFNDKFFTDALRQWLEEGKIDHDTSHVRDAANFKLPEKPKQLGQRLARELKKNKAILGVFDEGCMGMFNAIIPDHLLHATGVFKERLSQSALYAAMRAVPDTEAREVRRWLDKKGVEFKTGPNEETDLTDAQIHEQCKMYIAALRIADDFGCDAVGIQYQQGLKDLTPASDLVEGLLNNSDRPPVKSLKSGKILHAGAPLPHFNEVDECAGLDALITNRVWTALKQPPETTLHDVRWGEHFKGRGPQGPVDDYVWVFLISGAAPAAHFISGYKGASSERQPPMYFRLGGGTLKGVSKPGEIVWSRIFVMNEKLHMDIGRARVVALPEVETERRWQATTPPWPIMHAVLNGVTRDQFMARHKANHIQVAYATSAAAANDLLTAKIAMAMELGIETHICGDGNGLT